MKIDPETPILQALTHYCNWIIVAVLWVVCSLPVITAGASTTAMMTVMLQMVRKEDTGSVAAEFFKAFKREFGQATKAWLIIFAVLAVIGLNIYSCARMDHYGVGGPAFWAITVILGIVTLAVAFYVFPILARYRVSIKQLFGNAVICAGKNPVCTLILLILFMLMVLVIWWLLPLSLLIVGPILFLMALTVQSVLTKRFPEEQQAAGKNSL